MKKAVTPRCDWAPTYPDCGAAAWAAARSRVANSRDGRCCLRSALTSTTQATAHTTYGTIGVKVWIFKGEVLRPVTAGCQGSTS